VVREGNVGEILDDGAGNKLPGLLTRLRLRPTSCTGISRRG
jgi:hypothetical protein